MCKLTTYLFMFIIENDELKLKGLFMSNMWKKVFLVLPKTVKQKYNYYKDTVY